MSDFVKYMHVERLNHMETEGLLEDTCHIFYKIDGTNGSVWWDGEKIRCGSRNRELSLENDNAGFMHWVYANQDKFLKFFKRQYPQLRLVGEWLVPHSLKTYRESAWRDFYVFDVIDGDRHIPYSEYQPVLEECGINYIPPLAIYVNPSADNLMSLLEKSGQFLIEDGKGIGEGIVIKNYDFKNKFGRTVWAKIISNEFKERHHKEMGAPLINGTMPIEQEIVDNFLSDAFLEKERAKIEVENGGWDNKCIPKFLGVVYYTFINEEMYNILKKYKNPKIDFASLNRLVISKSKKTIGL